MSASAVPDDEIPVAALPGSDEPVELFLLLRSRGDPRPALESAFRARGARTAWSARLERLLIGDGELHWSHAAIAHAPSRSVLLEAVRAASRAAGLDELAAHPLDRLALPAPVRALLGVCRLAGRLRRPAEPDPDTLETPPGMEASPCNPPLERLRALARDRSEAPAFMINLLRFRERAAYPEPGRELSGRSAYLRYGIVAMRSVAMLGGAMEHVGRLGEPVSDRAGLATSGPWDELAIVRYPRPRSLLQLERMPGYVRSLAHRNAGLERTALLVSR